MDSLSVLSLAMGAAWASGINLYATVLVLGLLGATGLVTLPDGLTPLSSPIVLGAAGIAYLAEFFADKIPGLDSLWDAVHTFIRIPAGALLAAGAATGLGGDVDTALALLAGAVVAAGSHATKAGSRALINASPEPFSNWAASVIEDILVVGMLALALVKPAVFFGFLLGFLLIALWALPHLWRALRGIFGQFAARRRAGESLLKASGQGFRLAPLGRNSDWHDPE